MKGRVSDIVRRNARSPLLRVGAKIADAYLRAFWNESLDDQDKNGEAWLLRTLLAHSGHAPVVIDVGANEGQYAAVVRSLSAGARIHCFEIVPEVFEKLAARHSEDPLIKLNSVGLSDAAGQVTVYVPTDRSSKNSYIARSNRSPVNAIERPCAVAVGCEYVAANHLERIDLIKIDTEGHDLHVLRGFASVLDRVRVIQFEYTKLYNISGHSLGDAYRLLEPLGWSVGRLHPDWITFGSYSSANDERFRTCNYVAVHPREAELRAALAG